MHMRTRIITALIFAGSLLTLAGNVQPEPLARPAQVSRASVDAATPNRLVYNAASTGVLADLAAITANRVVITDSNGLPIASSALTASRLLVSDVSGFPASRAALTANRIVQTGADGLLTENAAITASRALASDGSGFLTASATTATELGFISGLTSAVQPQLDTKTDTVTDTATVDLTKSSTTLSADVLRAALFPKTLGKNPAGNQAITASTETDVTGLTALNLPVLTTVNTRTYRVWGVIKVANGGASAGRFDARFYNGTNGTKADTMIDQSFTYIGAGSSAAIPVGPLEFTPGNSAHTKFGVAVSFPQNGNVLGATTTQSYILVEEVP